MGEGSIPSGSAKITRQNLRKATNRHTEVDMAARMRKTHQDDVRAKIQASYYVGRLHDHIIGKKEMTESQIKAAKILLDKSLPNLSDVKLETGAQGITFNLNTGVKPGAK